MHEDEGHAHFHERVEIHLHVHGPITVNMIGPPATPPSDVTEKMAAELVKDAKQMRQSLLTAQAAVVALVQSQTNLTTAYAAYVADEPKRLAAAVAEQMAADGADEDTIAAAIQEVTATATANVSAALDAIHANTSQPTAPPVDSLPTTPPVDAGADTNTAETTQAGGAGDDSLQGGNGADSITGADTGAASTQGGGQGDDALQGGNGGDQVQAAPPVLATPVVADDSTPTASDLAANDPTSVIAGNADGSAPVAVVSTDPTITGQVGSPASVIVTDHPTDGTTLITPVLSPDTPAVGSVTVDDTTGAPTPVAS